MFWIQKRQELEIIQLFVLVIPAAWIVGARKLLYTSGV